MLIHTCHSCSNQFSKPNNPNRPYRFCSTKCAGKSVVSKKKINSICCQCGITFSMWPCEAAKGRSACSRSCGDAKRDRGRTKESFRIRTSNVYKQWRESVFKRDSYTCQICGQTGGKLNADHILRFSEYPELRLSIDNGRTLCVSCHLKTETFGNRKPSQVLAVGQEA